MPTYIPLSPDTVLSPDTLLYPDGILVGPGGGGFGAVMSREHTARYKPAYEAGYRPAYESHLRKQKSGR